MIENTKFFMVPARGGKVIHVLGQTEEFLHSDGTVSVFINRIMPGMGVPMHIHREMDESCYVLSGRVKFVTDTESAVAEPGDYVSVARGTSHGFLGIGTEPIEMLWVTTPGGYDEFFEALSQVPIGAHGPDMGAMVEVGARFKTEFTGPVPA